MNFYCLTDDKEKVTSNLLKGSCEERGINFIEIDSDSYDYSKKVHLSCQDILYKASVIRGANEVEKYLLNKEVTTLYSSFASALSVLPNQYVLCQIYKLPFPKFIPDITADRSLLKKYVDYLGGFPIIIKARKGSHGIGVMRVDSLPALFSLVDYLLTKENKFIMQEYINVKSSARLIVLGGKVIDSIEYSTSENDFRSNEGREPIVKKRKYDKALEVTAIKAVKAKGVDFAGVDILVNDNGGHYLLEMNFPCYFSRCQLLTNVDISGQMVDYLVSKAKK